MQEGVCHIFKFKYVREFDYFHLDGCLFRRLSSGTNIKGKIVPILVITVTAGEVAATVFITLSVIVLWRWAVAWLFSTEKIKGRNHDHIHT